jgi:Lrp/AsnC family leucine-responsive transcriptional regulator
MTIDNHALLDDIGWQILRELQLDARLSFHELGRRVGLSAPATAERVRKLEDSGIITSYGARVDAQRVGLPITAIIRMTTLKVTFPRQPGEMSAIFPEMLECHRVTGTDSYILKIVVSSITHLEQVINRLVPYGEPATSIVLSSIISNEIIKQEAQEIKREASG